MSHTNLNLVIIVLYVSCDNDEKLIVGQGVK